MGNGNLNPTRPLNRRGPRHIGLSGTRAWTAPATSGYPSPTNEVDKPLFGFDATMTPTPSYPPKRGSCYTIYEVATPPSLDLADNRSLSQNSSDTSGSCSMSFSPPNPMHPHTVQSGYGWAPRSRVSPSYTPYCTCYSTEHNPYASPTPCYYHPYYPNAPVHYPMRSTSYHMSPVSYDSVSAPPSQDPSSSGSSLITVSSYGGSASPPPPPQDEETHEEKEEEMCPALRIYEESKKFYGWYI